MSKSINNKSYLIQNKSELNRKWLQNIKNIGITAGASTPEKVILEIEKDILLEPGSNPRHICIISSPES